MGHYFLEIQQVEIVISASSKGKKTENAVTKAILAVEVSIVLYCMPKKSCPILYRNLLYQIRQAFLGSQCVSVGIKPPI